MPTAESRVRVGLIGAGSMGAYTADIIARLPALEVAGVADVNQPAARALGEKLGVPWWTDHRELLARCACDAVGISTPHDTHHAISLDAAGAGRHIFCEKAMAIHVAECHAMIAAARAAGVKLMVGHKRRFRPAYAELKRLLDRGEFGRPMALNVQGFFGRKLSGWWARRTACGGLLHWAGVHDVDTIRYLLGEVREVYALDGPKLFPNDTDYQDALAFTLKFANGAVGSFQVSTYYPLASYRTAFAYQIVCEHGGLAYDPRQVAVHAQKYGQPMTTTFFEGYGHDVAFDKEWSNFAAWVLHDEPPILTGEDGLRCVEILQAAYLSVALGQPVKLPLAATERRPWSA
ncbi:MAG: Gfo/Idh/MocA family oxidoreductase [Actinobacteria bacterium]|nr:Gfo/Idh/MocA family oxidoreductase [Actinomycetota bacterium]